MFELKPIQDENRDEEIYQKRYEMKVFFFSMENLIYVDDREHSIGSIKIIINKKRTKSQTFVLNHASD